MPTDIIRDLERIKMTSNQESDEFSPIFQQIKQIWQDNTETATDNETLNYLTEYSTNSTEINFVKDNSECYITIAQNEGYIIGNELEKVKAKSRRSLMQQMSSHISKNFQSLYGKENTNNRQNYFQIGVRVPSKEHVSEIVGKQGIKIKEIRETTGALIITPGESEDHVFIIEALPTIAISVARTIATRAKEISNNRLRERDMHGNNNINSTSSNNNNNTTNTTNNNNNNANITSCINRRSPSSPIGTDNEINYPPLYKQHTNQQHLINSTIITNSNSMTTNSSSISNAGTIGAKHIGMYNKNFNNIGQSIMRPILASGFIEVPRTIVGRIIGTHGSIITTIQKDTGTEIRSPPKDATASSASSTTSYPNIPTAKFEILVYQKSTAIDNEEANQRIRNAKQLIAHVAMHQMERIRAEESPFSNYRIRSLPMSSGVWEAANNNNNNSNTNNNSNSDQNSDENSIGSTKSDSSTSRDKSNLIADKEQLLNYQMQSVAWLWDDIDRLDENVADEVVLRILEESKKKSKLRNEYTLNDGINYESSSSSSSHNSSIYKTAAVPSQQQANNNMDYQKINHGYENNNLSMISQQQHHNHNSNNYYYNKGYNNYNGSSTNNHNNRYNYESNTTNNNNNNYNSKITSLNQGYQYGYEPHQLPASSSTNIMTNSHHPQSIQQQTSCYLPIANTEFDKSCRMQSNVSNHSYDNILMPQQQQQQHHQVGKSYADNFKNTSNITNHHQLQQQQLLQQHSMKCQNIFGAIGDRMKQNNNNNNYSNRCAQFQ